MFKWASQLINRIKSSLWQPMLGGNAQYRGFYDQFQSLKEPDKIELAQGFEDIIYSCVMLRVHSMTSVPLRLYVKTMPGDNKPKAKTKAITDKRADYLIKQNPTLSSAVQIHEVLDHPTINFFRSQRHTLEELLEYTQIYMDLAGSAYWYVEREGLFNTPSKVYILPSQYVYIVLSENGYDVYSYVMRMFNAETKYDPRNVVNFSQPNPAYPYGEGFSPLRAVWERFKLGKLQLGYLGNYLTNQARPDAIATPEEPIGQPEADRYAKDFADRFKQGGIGGIMFANEKLTISPLNFSPKDLGTKDFNTVVKTGVCNCFGIPPGWFETQSTFSQIEANQYMLSQHTIHPLLKKRDAVLNNNFLPMFEEPRLFFASDDPVPENKDRELEKIKFGLQQGAVSRNYYRHYLGLEEKPEYDVPLLPSGYFPENSKPVQGDFSKNVLQLQTLVFQGQLSREAAIANCVGTMNMSEQDAEKLFPITDKPEDTNDKPEEANE